MNGSILRITSLRAPSVELGASNSLINCAALASVSSGAGGGPAGMTVGVTVVTTAFELATGDGPGVAVVAGEPVGAAAGGPVGVTLALTTGGGLSCWRGTRR